MGPGGQFYPFSWQFTPFSGYLDLFSPAIYLYKVILQQLLALLPLPPLKDRIICRLEPPFQNPAHAPELLNFTKTNIKLCLYVDLYIID